MRQEFYQDSPWLHLPIFALLLFVAVFVTVVAWLFIFQRKNPRIQRLASIPLEPDETPRELAPTDETGGRK